LASSDRNFRAGQPQTIQSRVAEIPLAQLAGGRQHFIGADSDAYVFGKVVPANDLRPVDQKLRWTGNIVSFRTPSNVKEVIATNRNGIAIGKDRERVSSLVGQLLRYSRRIRRSSLPGARLRL
jgi:hypothetical protein